MVFIIVDGSILLARRLNTWFGENEFALLVEILIAMKRPLQPRFAKFMRRSI